MFAIDHVAFPCFDVAATLRFYTGILGGVLRHAQSGPAEVWNAKEYLLVAFELPGGVVIDFFSFDGIDRVEDARAARLPKEIRHLALSVETRAEVTHFKECFEREGVPFWVETHEVDDVHVYATDPNGVVLEILASEDGVHARRKDDTRNARRVVDGWMADRDPGEPPRS